VGDIVSFGVIANGTSVFKSGSFTANTVAESTNGIYIFDISNLTNGTFEDTTITQNDGNTGINALAILSNTSTRLIGVSADSVNSDARYGTKFGIKYANGVSITHDSSNAAFRVIESYMDAGNSNQWIIEASTADSVVPTTATFTFEQVNSNTLTVANSYQDTVNANVWYLEITGANIIPVANTRISAQYGLGLPLQMSDSTVAQFLNKQFR
jgi:hypothetical protein